MDKTSRNLFLATAMMVFAASILHLVNTDRHEFRAWAEECAKVKGEVLVGDRQDYCVPKGTILLKRNR